MLTRAQVIIGTSFVGGTGCPIVINVTRGLAPHSADRFFVMSQAEHFQGGAFYRVVAHEVVEFGISPRVQDNDDMEEHHENMTADAHDDPFLPTMTNTKGAVSFVRTNGHTDLMRIAISMGTNTAFDDLVACLSMCTRVSEYVCVCSCVCVCVCVCVCCGVY